MSTLASTNLTIADAAKRILPSGQAADIAELLHQTNSIITDAPWVEGDTAGGHMSVQDTSLPTISTRQANSFVSASKSTQDQIMEAPEVLEGWSVVDELVARYGGDVAGKRAQEAARFVESMKQTCADRIIYGNGTTTPGQINGLGTRLNSSSGNAGDNVILGGSLAGQTDNMSIWLIGWAPRKVYMWYPKGSPGGLHVKDLGLVPDFNSSGQQRMAYKEQFQWSIGLAVDDWRYVARIPNIDLSLLLAGTGADLFDKMIQATHCIPDLSACRPVFYMNRTTRMMLDIQARNDVTSGGQLTYEMVAGKPVEMFRGIPIRILDRLTEAETRIS